MAGEWVWGESQGPGNIPADSAARLEDGQGDIEMEKGDWEAARSLYNQALGIFRELGDHRGIARALTDLGHLACSEGDYESAEELYMKGLKLFFESGDIRAITHVLEGMACAASATGKCERALRLGGAAGALRQRYGSPLVPLPKPMCNEGWRTHVSI